MAVPKKRVSKTRGSLRHTNWKKEIIPQALIALSTGKKQANLRKSNFVTASQSYTLSTNGEQGDAGTPTGIE